MKACNLFPLFSFIIWFLQETKKVLFPFSLLAQAIRKATCVPPLSASESWGSVTLRRPSIISVPTVTTAAVNKSALVLVLVACVAAVAAGLIRLKRIYNF
jgi:hypothetical protein